jgi:hypothetical protein
LARQNGNRRAKSMILQARQLTCQQLILSLADAEVFHRTRISRQEHPASGQTKDGWAPTAWGGVPDRPLDQARHCEVTPVGAWSSAPWSLPALPGAEGRAAPKLVPLCACWCRSPAPFAGRTSAGAGRGSPATTRRMVCMLVRSGERSGATALASPARIGLLAPAGAAGSRPQPSIGVQRSGPLA